MAHLSNPLVLLNPLQLNHARCCVRCVLQNPRFLHPIPNDCGTSQTYWFSRWKINHTILRKRKMIIISGWDIDDIVIPIWLSLCWLIYPIFFDSDLYSPSTKLFHKLPGSGGLSPSRAPIWFTSSPFQSFNSICHTLMPGRTSPGARFDRLPELLSVPGLVSTFPKSELENGHRNSGVSHETWWFSSSLC